MAQIGEGNNLITAGRDGGAADLEREDQSSETVLPENYPFVEIGPSRGWVSINWHELWTFRELLYFPEHGVNEV